MVLCSCDLSGPLVLWSSGPVLLLSYSPLVRWPSGSVAKTTPHPPNSHHPPNNTNNASTASTTSATSTTSSSSNNNSNSNNCSSNNNKKKTMLQQTRWSISAPNSQGPLTACVVKHFNNTNSSGHSSEPPQFFPGR